MVKEMKWSDEYKMYYYWDGGNKCHWITNGIAVLDEETGRYGVYEEGRWTEVASGSPGDDKREKRRKVEGKRS
jgi:hypothetical protein